MRLFLCLWYALAYVDAMNATEMSTLLYLQRISSQLSDANQRACLQLQLDSSSQNQLLADFICAQGYKTDQVAWFTDKSASENLIASYYDIKQGQKLLGREVKLLIFDVAAGFDANSFTAANGALVGGGLLIFLNLNALADTASSDWLKHHLAQWPIIDNLLQPPTDIQFAITTISPAANNWLHGMTLDQHAAVKAIEKVATGHRKRPLVINANRGRGKSSALGIAAAQLLASKQRHIVVTAPNIKSVAAIFFHANDKLCGYEVEVLDSSQYQITLSNGSQLTFIAADELLRHRPECDLLLVDEAAALPIKMLIALCQYYHRMVFSSTIHGYEGCGRGFTLKFTQWLLSHRPGWQQLEMTQAIRWSDGDPLETWLFNCFLLSPQSHDITELKLSELQLKHVPNSELLLQPDLLAEVFALLVIAHYQTTPNDLWQLLDDPDVALYIMQHANRVVACALVNLEGGLSAQMVAEVQQGNRRPRGHLAALNLVNHLALDKAGLQRSARIMRIAVHPSVQRQSVGQLAVQSLLERLQANVDFVSTSFGATDELLKFWQRQDFSLVRLGSSRDQASGCYSVIMVKALSFDAQAWIVDAKQQFKHDLVWGLPSLFIELETELLRQMLAPQIATVEQAMMPNLLHNYALGGNCFESVLPYFGRYLLVCLSHYHLPLDLGLKCAVQKVLQQRDWRQVAADNGLTGRKQVEQQLQLWLKQLLPDNHEATEISR